jgi:hypothetical protein
MGRRPSNELEPSRRASAARVLSTVAATVVLGFALNALAPATDASATPGRCNFGPYTVQPASDPGAYVYAAPVDLNASETLSPVKVRLQKLNLDGADSFYVSVDSSFTGRYWAFDGSAAAHGESPDPVGQQPPGFSAYRPDGTVAGQLMVARFIRFAARWTGTPGAGASATYFVSFC